MGTNQTHKHKHIPTTMVEDWFFIALNGLGLLNKGFSNPSLVNCLLGLDNDGVVGSMGLDFWLMSFSLFLGFVMGMAEQKNELKEWDVTILFVGIGLFVGFVMGSHVTILCNTSGWAPSFGQKLELKSERYKSILEPNTNCREIWVIVGLEIWVMNYEFEIWVLRYDLWAIQTPPKVFFFSPKL